MSHHGGHNPLEAARLNCGVVLGPDMENFATVTSELVKAKGAIQVASANGCGFGNFLCMTKPNAVEW